MAASWRPLLQREDDDTSEGVFCFSLPLFDSRSARVFFRARPVSQTDVSRVFFGRPTFYGNRRRKRQFGPTR